MAQKPIMNYFKPINRVLHNSEVEQSMERKAFVNKKQKVSHSPTKETDSEVATPLSPSQKERILRNKLNLSEFLASERSQKVVYPPEHQVYSWTQHCDIQDVKVVILGQDPYHGIGQAHGLCFSVTRGIPPPPSLENIYKELQSDIPGFKHPQHGYLVGWAKQGVLLLNACLTVRANCANSHKDKGWEEFTDAVIKKVSETNKGVIFLLWGSYAQKKAAIVDKKRHHMLNAPHPSPLSAHRGFFGCKHFSKCNDILGKEGKSPIDWSYLPIEESL